MESDSDRLPRGQRVLVSGLSARSDVNGLAAEVQHFDESVGRYAILVLVTGEQLRVKPEHISAVAEPSHDDEQSLPSWQDGLGTAAQYEWLADCYRLRLDDDMNYASFLHGIYHPAPTAMTIFEDFLLFAKLARARGVVPASGWDWTTFCEVAAPLLRVALPQHEALEKHGVEQLQLQSGASASRSLRSTAERVYGSDPLAERDPFCEIVEDQIQTALEPEPIGGSYYVDTTLESDAAIFADVGGAAAWKRLLAEVS